MAVPSPGAVALPEVDLSDLPPPVRLAYSGYRLDWARAKQSTHLEAVALAWASLHALDGAVDGAGALEELPGDPSLRVDGGVRPAPEAWEALVQSTPSPKDDVFWRVWSAHDGGRAPTWRQDLPGGSACSALGSGEHLATLAQIRSVRGDDLPGPLTAALETIRAATIRDLTVGTDGLPLCGALHGPGAEVPSVAEARRELLRVAAEGGLSAEEVLAVRRRVDEGVVGGEAP